MNLKEFLDYRTCCPICSSKLSLELITDHGRKYSMRIEDNKVSGNSTMKSLTLLSKSYTVGVCFSLEDDSCWVDVYSGTNKCLESFSHSMLDMLDKFFTAACSRLVFRRQCQLAPHYFLESNDFNLPRSQLAALTVRYEQFNLHTTIEQGEFKTVSLINWMEKNISKVSMDATSFELIDLPLVPFVSEEITIQRIFNLLPFN
jgi:hypothetical protein